MACSGTSPDVSALLEGVELPAEVKQKLLAGITASRESAVREALAGQGAAAPGGAVADAQDDVKKKAKNRFQPPLRDFGFTGTKAFLLRFLVIERVGDYLDANGGAFEFNKDDENAADFYKTNAKLFLQAAAVSGQVLAEGFCTCHSANHMR